MLNRNAFDNLPIEVLLEIFSYLSPETIAKATRVNKKFCIAANNNLFWQKKFQRHFSHITVAIENNTNWYSEFRKAYDDEYKIYDEKDKTYKALSTNIRKLFSLVKEGDIASLDKILKLKDLDQTDKNGLSLFDWAKKKNNQKLLDYFYQLAVKEYESGITSDVTKTDNKKRTILHWAILCHQPVSTVNLLIVQGADINALSAIGHNALRLAAREGKAEIVELLLGHGADINARSALGATALLFAIEYSHKNVVDVLLKHNADITIPLQTSSTYHDKFNVKAGDTPLHAASKSGSPAIIRRLLTKNANIEAINSNNQTPVEVAVKDSMCSHELKLLDYSIKTNRRQDNHFKTSFTIFGHTFNFGCSAKQKKDATNALKSVIFDGADKSCLYAHQEALNNGDLKTIYRSLKVR